MRDFVIPYDYLATVVERAIQLLWDKVDGFGIEDIVDVIDTWQHEKSSGGLLFTEPLHLTTDGVSTLLYHKPTSGEEIIIDIKVAGKDKKVISDVPKAIYKICCGKYPHCFENGKCIMPLERRKLDMEKAYDGLHLYYTGMETCKFQSEQREKKDANKKIEKKIIEQKLKEKKQTAEDALRDALFSLRFGVKDGLVLNVIEDGSTGLSVKKMASIKEQLGFKDTNQLMKMTDDEINKRANEYILSILESATKVIRRRVVSYG